MFNKGLKTIKNNNFNNNNSNNNNSNNKNNNIRSTISSLTNSFSNQFPDNFYSSMNPFDINLDGITKINNMKQFILYAFISNNNLDGIKLYNTYVNKLYNKKNNKYTLDITKIMNNKNKNTLDLINSDFYYSLKLQ